MPTNNKTEVQGFVANYFGDLNKAIVTVGIASYFFKELPMPLRIGCGMMAVVFFFIAVIIINSLQGEKKMIMLIACLLILFIGLGFVWHANREEKPKHSH